MVPGTPIYSSSSSRRSGSSRTYHGCVLACRAAQASRGNSASKCGWSPGSGGWPSRRYRVVSKGESIEPASQQGKVFSPSGPSTKRRSCARMPTKIMPISGAATRRRQFQSSTWMRPGPTTRRGARFLQPVRRATSTEPGRSNSSCLVPLAATRPEARATRWSERR